MFASTDRTDLSISSKLHISDDDLHKILKYGLVFLPVGIGVILLIVVICQIRCICKAKKAVREKERQSRLRTRYHVVYNASGDELEDTEKTSLSTSSTSSGAGETFDYGSTKPKPILNWIPYQAKVSISRPSRRRASDKDSPSKDKSKLSKAMSSSETSILGDLPPLEEVQYLEVPKMELSDQAGNVLVTIDYKVQTKTLVLIIESAHDLPVEMFGGPGSRTTVAVKMQLNINQRESEDEKLGVLTEGRRFTANPVFNSSFEHHLESRDMENASLHLSLIIWGKYAPKKTIAETTLHLGSADTGKKCRASLAFSPVEMRSAGEVLVSLCYLPTSARFIVGIMKATGLESRRGDGCDPCVRITILIGGKRLWKRKTAIHVNQRNPVFEEMFVFDVPQEKLDKVKFLIMLTDERETVLSPVGEAPENEIGRVVLGRGCSLEANIHWSEIRKQPRRPIAQWYSLY